MFRILFLLLVLMSSIAFAQTEETPKAAKLVEFGKVTNGYIKMQLDSYFTELNNNPSAQGYVVNYGSAREALRVEKVIRRQISVRRYDVSRITFARGGDAELKTEFWIVPAGAELPKL